MTHRGVMERLRIPVMLLVLAWSAFFWLHHQPTASLLVFPVTVAALIREGASVIRERRTRMDDAHPSP